VGRGLKAIGLGVVGLALAVSLSLGAFALAGRPLGEPATAVRISGPTTSDHGEHERPSASLAPDLQIGGTSTSSPHDPHGEPTTGGSPSSSHGSDDRSSEGDD
jgi:hypothetical protein